MFAKNILKIVMKFKPNIEYYPVLPVFALELLVFYALAKLLSAAVGFDLWKPIPFVWRLWVLF
ncbi:hypothetical protein [Pyrococcus sp.]|uniref:hypothetical protein n=1 Tax=Pyrococcus sp. TaxID=33866 RepID=UPI00258BA522|nr:hypothetical protein [Pyrococcus sp.]